MDLFELNEYLDDETDILELIEYGFPRKIYDRKNYFESMDELNFF